MTWPRRLLRLCARLLLTALLGGFLGATLVRLAPGFSFDERELDPRYSRESIERMRAAGGAERRSVLAFYAGYLRNLFSGNLGESRAYRRPVSQLFSERVPVTLKSMGVALLIAWPAGLGLALLWSGGRNHTYELVTTLASGALLCLPSAVLALFFLYMDGPVALAMAVVILPRVFRFARNLITETGAMPHVLCASAKGVSRAGIVWRHLLPVAAPQLLALAGVSVSMALGASIPIEVICDSPGIGQLAWHAAQSRDLLVLVNVTLFVALVTLLANSLADAAGGAFERQPA